MSDTGSNCDNKPQQEDVNLEESQAEAVPEVENKPVTPVKRTPSKRLSAVERAQRESEELVKTLGGSLDIEGGRKTRSSTRGTPSRSNVVNTPPPTKKARGTGTPKRGRGRKLETAIEDDIKTSPEKAPSEPESNHEENESSAAGAAKEKPEDDKSETIEKPSDVAEEKPSPAKQDNKDDKPEPMEVDGVSKENASELEKSDESAQNKSEESSSKPNDDEVEKSDKVVTETLESSKAVDEASEPPLSTDVEESTPLDNDKADSAHENNVKANDIKKVNSNSLPAEEVSLPTPTPATQVSVAGNEHKAESNDLCEPKIASPPITANNDGATPQYCN